MPTPAAPDFAAMMSASLDALPESGEIPDAPALPVVSDGAGTADDAHGETETSADGTGAGDAGTAGGEGSATESGDGADDGDGGTADTAEARNARAAAAEGRERNPDGTFKTAEQQAATKPDAATAAKPPVKPADPVNDPIPTNLKPATAERMTKLVETAKTLTTRAETAERDLDTLVQSVEKTGMNGQEFGEFLTVVGLARSEKVEDQETAYDYLTKVVTQLAATLGKTPPGQDSLDGHEDLTARVAAGHLTLADAEQIADARRQHAAMQTRQTLAQQRQQQTTVQQQQFEQARATGKAQMVELEQTLAAADPQFAQKKALLMADAPFMQALKATHPSQWVTAFNKRYRETKIAAAAAPAARKAVPGNAPQPLRGKAPAGGQQVTAAKSIDEAMANIDFSKA